MLSKFTSNSFCGGKLNLFQVFFPPKDLCFEIQSFIFSTFFYTGHNFSSLSIKMIMKCDSKLKYFSFITLFIQITLQTYQHVVTFTLILSPCCQQIVTDTESSSLILLGLLWWPNDSPRLTHPPLPDSHPLNVGCCHCYLSKEQI